MPACRLDCAVLGPERDTGVMHDLPLDAYLWAIVPLPAWSADVDPHVVEWSDVVDAEVFATAAANGLGRLQGLRFDVLPRDSWEIGDVVVVGACREDATVLVAAMQGSMFVATICGPVDERSVRAALAAAPNEGVATFGAFPLPRETDALRAVVEQHLTAFAEVAAPALAQSPVDADSLSRRLDAAVQERRTPLFVRHFENEVSRGRASGRHALVVEAPEELARFRPLTTQEQEWLDEARIAEAAQPPPLTRSDGESDRDWLQRRADYVRTTAARLDLAFENRWSPSGRDDWDDAARASRQSLDLIYSDEFWEKVEELQLGDGTHIDFAIDFLAVDVWCFRSGYVKQRLLEILCRHSFDSDQTRRLEAVLLRAVDVGDRREFGASCRLARRLQSQLVREGLHERIISVDRGIARRALWMLIAMRRPRLSEVEIEVAQAIVLEAASDEDRWWSARSWIQRLLPTIENEPWVRSIIDGAVDDRDPRCLRLISELRTANLDRRAAEALAELVLDAVRRGEDTTWLEGVAPLARRDGLLESLEALRASPDPDVQRRAWWAVRAIELSG